MLTTINQDFNSHFQEWFSTLVEDQSKEARVDENFTPLVESRMATNRTSTTSAEVRRRAWPSCTASRSNGVVRRVSMGMKSNLLILDEPTDGFSKSSSGR